jgi:diamine N-acetyltransferase
LTSVRVVQIDAGNWRNALEVRVTPEQLAFVADHQPVALVILAKAYVQPGEREWEPLAIVDDAGQIVGVVALAHSAETCEMQNLVIDAAHQRQGLGGHAVTAIVEHVKRRWPRCREMWLTVHPENHPAQRLYARTGFADTGERRDDEPIWKLMLEHEPRAT